MKVIDLLNKIANGEEVPKKVKYKTFYWKYSEKDRDYKDTDKDYVFSCSNYDIPEMLNNEVEIIEEDNKIEYIECRIKNFKHYLEDSCFRVKPLEDLELNQNEIVIIDKINEIIDKINESETK